jgi:ligand-binding SRPBCC domain-containing protein
MMFRFQQAVEAHIDAVEAFYGNAANLLRISPPFPRLRIHNTDTAVVAGRTFSISLDAVLWKTRWQTVIEDVQPGKFFVDTMHGTLIRSWQHVHRFEATDRGTLLTDEIECTTHWWLVPVVWIGVRACSCIAASPCRRCSHDSGR